jgi:hypothetical protein
MLERFALQDEAIKYYEMARHVDPNNILALRRLADLYQRVGRSVEAENARVAVASLSHGSGAVAGLER